MINKGKRSGAALITVIVIMAVLAILGFSIMAVSVADTKYAAYQGKKVQAHYLGRSGILFGLDLLDKKIEADKINTVSNTVDSLNEKVQFLSPDTSFTIKSEGKFKLKYEVFSPNKIKIIAEGITSGNSSVSDIVTYIVRVRPAEFMITNPNDWITGINLQKDIEASRNHYLGKGVEFALNNELHSPKNPNQESVFQASILYFRNYKGMSLKQITNSLPFTFDTEILYFESGIELNKNKDSLFLGISNTVLNHRASNRGVLDSYPRPVGFQDEERYKAFIEGCSSNLYSTYKSRFDITKNYGLVYFGENVTRDGEGMVIEKGYYFYPNGVDLQADGVNSKLIQIPEEDAIIKAIKKFFKSSRIGYMWNNK